MDLSWMAWTLPTAIFFMVIAVMVITLIILAIKYPEVPRRGILGMETTRGDRLFISLLGSAFIGLGWLGGDIIPVWGMLIAQVFYGFLVFRYV